MSQFTNDGNSWFRRIINRMSKAQSTAFSTPMPDSNVPLDDLYTFTETDKGSGVFGKWIVDACDLPAYEYTMNQCSDDAISYPTSQGKRYEHWHQIGNKRVTGIASNHGTVQVYLGDRGGVILNDYDADDPKGIKGILIEFLETLLYAPIRSIQIMLIPKGLRPSYDVGFIQRLKNVFSKRNIKSYLQDENAYVGGYAYLNDDSETWSTAYRYQSETVRQKSERVFGMGYFKTVTEHQNTRVTRHVYAPKGNVSFLLADVKIENTSDAAIDLNYYEYWDVNVQQISAQLLRTGPFGKLGDAERREINGNFNASIKLDGRALRFHQKAKGKVPKPDASDLTDWYPADVFLADLSSGETEDHFTDKHAFFGDGGAMLPDAVVQHHNGEIIDEEDFVMPYCMVIKRKVHLEAGESVDLRFAYGTTERHKDLELDAYVMDNSLFKEMYDEWKKRLAYFTIGTEPALQREMAWHAYYLISSTIYQDFYKIHVVPQGSAYLYLHGLDGAPRDQGLFALPLTYLDPQLARDQLRLMMQVTDGESGQIHYSFASFGMVIGGGLHEAPSDLDIFFLLAMTEYLAATGDFDFLDEEVRFYPGGVQPDDLTVWNHVRVAVNHLINEVGLGENNLVRISDGDWSDGIVLKNILGSINLLKPHKILSYTKSVEHGESIPNSQMALYVLPRIYNLIEGLSSQKANELAQWMKSELDDYLPKLEEGVQGQWVGEWYTRAVLRTQFGDKGVPIDANVINLESQVWALINELDTTPTLVKSVFNRLDSNSLIGGQMTNNKVWPAVSQLLTWGYTRTRPEWAWRTFYNNTFIKHTEVFPKIWINIWSGPDGTNGPDVKDPGFTWESQLTPMRDFPIMNNNPHSMALFGLLRVCGIEPTESGDGIRIHPQIPNRYNIDMGLLQVKVESNSISGYYRPIVDGSRKLYIHVGSEDVAVSINGESVTPTFYEDDVVLALEMKKDEHIAFEVKWS